MARIRDNNRAKAMVLTMFRIIVKIEAFVWFGL